jgi:hypothetical protein
VILCVGYTDDAHLMRLLCGLHLLSASCTSNATGVPPRFIGVMYDSHLSTEAATVATCMARLNEAVYAINNGEQPFAKCQVRHISPFALLSRSHFVDIS